MKLLTLDEIAAGIGIAELEFKDCVRMLRRKIKNHKIPFSKWGRHIMLRPEHAEQLIDAVTEWHLGSSSLKTQKTGTSGGQSVAARSTKALDSIPNA